MVAWHIWAWRGLTPTSENLAGAPERRRPRHPHLEASQSRVRKAAIGKKVCASVKWLAKCDLRFESGDEGAMSKSHAAAPLLHLNGVDRVSRDLHTRRECLSRVRLRRATGICQAFHGRVA